MTLTWVPHAISYKEKFSPKEAAELATLQFNKSSPFPCLYLQPAWQSVALVNLFDIV